MRLFSHLAVALVVASTSADEADEPALLDPEVFAGRFPFVAKWRGYHSEGEEEHPDVGLCTATLVAPSWILTASHCAIRYLRHEPVHAQVTFVPGGGIVRGVARCVHAHNVNETLTVAQEPDGTEVAAAGEDAALCKIKTPIHAFAPVKLNSDLYRTKGPHGKPVLCVGTAKGYHVVGPKKLLYEPSGGHLYVNNAGGSGMHAGDSGGAWLHTVPQNTTDGDDATAEGKPSVYVQSGVIHGSAGGQRGAAAQISFMRPWLDATVHPEVATWVSVGPKPVEEDAVSTPVPAEALR